MKQNKRGVSDVVTTILIIMLTIAAIGIIAGFVVPFVRNSLQTSTECKDYQGYYTFDESFGLNCNIENNYTFSIKSSSLGTGNDTKSNQLLRENVDKIKFVFTRSDGTTKSVEIVNGLPSSDMKMYNGSIIIRFPGPGGIESYNYTSTDTFESAEVYPVLKNKRICADVKESIKIKSCE